MSRAALQPARIHRILPDSMARDLGIRAGDRLVRINGERPRDLIDYQFAIADEILELELLDQTGKSYQVKLEKECDQDLGLEFETALFDGLIQCNNACPFCFIDQQPPEMRATLHLKDDDYRLSFLYGSYLTLTNLPPAEFDRIARLRLSPLYVSVHATDPGVRARLLKNPRAGLILEHLSWFRAQRLQIHAQVVVCPGWNDGAQLTRTLQDLAGFYAVTDPEALPTVISAAVVPVGLTRFRPPDDQISPVTPRQAESTIDQVEALQHQFRAQLGSTFAWLADEWYLLAQRPLPAAEHYEDYPQLGNGVGSLRQFLSEFATASFPARIPRPIHVTWVVGNAVQQAFQPIVQRLNQIERLTFTMVPIASQFWGQTLTVTGLLTGRDILQALGSVPLGSVLLLPAVTLKDGHQFLDDLTWQDLERELGIRVVQVQGGVNGLLQAISDACELESPANFRPQLAAVGNP